MTRTSRRSRDKRGPALLHSARHGEIPVSSMPTVHARIEINSRTRLHERGRVGTRLDTRHCPHHEGCVRNYAPCWSSIHEPRVADGKTAVKRSKSTRSREFQRRRMRRRLNHTDQRHKIRQTANGVYARAVCETAHPFGL